MDISFHLQILPAEGAPFDHVFREENLIVGRAADADLSLPDPFLSRRHSRFYRQGAKLFVEDLGSRNGTLLNGQAIRGPAELKPGDVIRISNSTILVSLERPSSSQSVLDDDPLDGTILRRAAELLDRQSSPESARLQNEADLRRYAERMKILNEIHQALGRSLTLSGLLELILDRVFDHLQPDRGAIFLKEADGELRPAAVRTPAGVADEVRVSRSLVREVTEKGMAALVLDVLSDDRFATAQSMLLSGIRSLVAAPLLDTEGTLGLIVLESRIQAR
ncbi:MAG TPA: FHA domain-containing protein, partial [Thermoanaerobaculia bacterium]|nr:FHA domain-containing protein [Thermoanaerobaculia bacterium]